MTPEQFDALAQLMRLSPDTPRGRALRSVLCDGTPVATAARAEGIAHPAVYRAAAEAKRVQELARIVLG
jgi:hypothetical protein